MTNQTDSAFGARQKFLAYSEVIIQQFMDVALYGEDSQFSGNKDFLQMAFKTLIPVIHLKDDPMHIKGADISERTDYVMDMMTKGQITAAQADRVINALKSGIDLDGFNALLDQLQTKASNF